MHFYQAVYQQPQRDSNPCRHLEREKQTTAPGVTGSCGPPRWPSMASVPLLAFHRVPRTSVFTAEPNDGGGQ
jgi:hypothetical protein